MNSPIKVANLLDIQNEAGNYYNKWTPTSPQNPKNTWPKVSPTIPANRPLQTDIHQEYKNILTSKLKPAEINEVINQIGGEDSSWHLPPKPTPPNQILTEDDKKKINFYDDLNKFFGNNIPSDLKAQWESLNKWPAKFPSETVDTAYDKYSEPKEKHTDYDAIKSERDGWTSLFLPPLTPQQVKDKYDEPKGATLTTDEQEAINNYQKIKGELKPWTDLFGTETAQQIKDKLDAKPIGGTVGADEKVVKTADWDELTKRPTKADYDKVVIERNEWTTKFPAPLTATKVDEYIKDYDLNVPKIMKLIKAHTNN